MTPDEIIEVMQGFKSGRGWQFLSTASEWKTPILSSLDSMLHALYSGQTIRLAPLPDEITLPARTIPAPLREAPKDAAIVFLADPFEDGGYNEVYFYKRDADHESWLKRGFFFATAEKAAKASKAMEPYAA